MLKNNKKGITLVALIATIMIIIILTTTAVVSFSSFSISARKKSFANEIYTLQKQVEDYKFRNNSYPLKNTREINMSDVDNNLWTIFVNNGEEIEANKINLYEIEYNKLDLETLARGTSTTENTLDIYLFSENTKKVYYLEGEKIGDEVYYYLTDDLYKSLKMK